MKNPSKFLALLAAGSICAMASGQASLLVYEGNNYTIPSNLQYSGSGEIADNSVDGAISLANVTSVQRSVNWMTGNLSAIGTQTLSYTDGNSNTLVTSGGQAELFNARGIQYNTSTFAATGGNIYGSFLWRTPTLNATNEWRSQFEIRNPGGLDVRIGLGLNGTYTDTDLQVRYGAPTNLTGIAINQNSTYYMVYRLNYNGTGQMTSLNLWLNPSDMSSELNSGAADLTYSGTIGGGGFAGFSYQKDNLSGGFNPVYDEIRIGTTWESVNVIPEPSSALLLGVGLAGLAYLRRRQKQA